MDLEPNLRQLRWLLAGAACALVLVLGAVVLLQPIASSGDWAQFLGRFHPLVVHLPIGVVLLVALAEVASLKPSLRARLDPVITPVLVLLLAAAVAAFIDGLLLARGGGYPEALLVPHKAFALGGVVLLCAALAAWSLHRHRSSARWRSGYRVVLGLGVAALSVGAHFGGSMTHGESYLVRFAPQPIKGWLGVESPPPSTPQPTKAAKEPKIFADVVLPVLTHYCVQCHGPDKVKGELRLDSYARLMKGGEAGPALTPGAPDKSRMLTMLRLPLADDDHMPPKNKPQPSPAEVELIAWWILRGAHEQERLREVVPPGKVFDLLKAALGSDGDRGPAPGLNKAGHAPVDPAAVADEPEPKAAATDPEALEPTASDDRTSSALTPGKSGLVYDDLVAPLLAARCTRCHGAQKQKGKLRLDTLAGLEKGGKAGPAVIPKHPAQSPLIQRLRLPLEADEHMPPKDEAQLTADQIQLLSWWIQDGAQPTTPRERLPIALATLRPPAPALAPKTPAADEVPAGAAPESEATAREADVPPAPAPAEILAKLPPEVHLFPQLIGPMLSDACGDCHIGEPLMGDLSVASVDDLMKSGTVVPGEPAQSELLRRVTLPASDDDRMPPEGEEPLSALEVAALRFWIEEGAELEAKWPREQLPGDVARAVAARVEAASPAPRSARADAAAAQVAPVARNTGSGCAACAVGTEPGTSGRVPAALGVLAWLGAWKHRSRAGQRGPPAHVS